jgi:hypothetical protein
MTILLRNVDGTSRIGRIRECRKIHFEDRRPSAHRSRDARIGWGSPHFGASAPSVGAEVD